MTTRSVFLMCAACLCLSAPRPAHAQTGIQRQGPSTQLVQSIPTETDLADPSLPFAKDVWVDMIRSARSSVDAAEFYVTSRPGSALEPVLAELEKAGARGVKVRLLLCSKMLDQDAASVARLRGIPGAEVR